MALQLLAAEKCHIAFVAFAMGCNVNTVIRNNEINRINEIEKNIFLRALCI